MFAMTAKSPALAAGFADPVKDAQAVFRGLLEAMSRPGRIARVDVDLPAPAPLAVATTAIVLALVDYETPLWIAADLRSEAAERHLKFHTGARLTETPKAAAFALLGRAPDDLTDFAFGTDEYPEAGATVVVQVGSIDPGGPLCLSGPGIRDSHTLSLPDVPSEFWNGRAALARHFPRGLDFVFVADRRFVAVPRTTVVAVEG